jgi:branched-chain amino acid transport system ATP-binding protein
VTDKEDLLRVADLHVRYGGLLALRGVSVELRANETVAVLGANGAGKSTLLNCIAGLVPAARGEIVYAGGHIAHAPAHRRASAGMALVPEGRMLFAPLTVAQNLRLGMLCAGWTGQAATYAQRVDEVLDVFPALREKLEVPAGDLSGGQQQMVGIGRALMSNPKVLLLDEPSLGLAPRIVDDVFEAIADLRRRRGLSVLLAEQNTEQALELADRGYVLQLGTVVLTDTAASIAARTDIAALYLGRAAEQLTGGRP